MSNNQGYNLQQNISFAGELGNDIMLLDGENALLVAKMIKENFVSAKHTRAISYLESKHLWRTFVGSPRKEVCRKEKDELIDFLYSYYKNEGKLSLTLKDVFLRSEEYRLNVQQRSIGTIERDKQVFERFFDDSISSKSIDKITDEYLADYIRTKTVELNLKERALKDSLQLLNRIFEYGINVEKVITANPCKSLTLENYYQYCDNTVKTSDDKIFTQAEIEEIKDRIRLEMADRDYDILGYAMLFSIETGVRVAEIPPLRWSDIEEMGVHIHRQQRSTRVKGKGKTYSELPYTKNERRHPKGGRYYPMTDEIIKILDEVKHRQEELGIESEFIFCDMSGKWICKDIYSQRLRRLCRRLGLHITNNHAFRMSLNSNVLIPMGIPVTQRAYLLGHSVETNERCYSHMRTESLFDIKMVLNGVTHTQSHTKLNSFPDIKKAANH